MSRFVAPSRAPSRVKMLLDVYRPLRLNSDSMEPTASTRVKALIVDDAAIMRRMLRDLLLGVGFLIVGEAGDGEKALELCKELRPHLVTLDITMPKKDGLTVLKEIKEFDPSIKVVMVSAMGQRENVIEAIKNGAENFIVKPFNADKIYRVIKGLRFSGRLAIDTVAGKEEGLIG